MAEMQKERGFNLNFQDEVLILAVLIIAAGVGFTDAYYSKFGFTYDVLDFSFVKILYQGIKVSLYKKLILVLYIFQLLLIILSKWMRSESSVKILFSFTYIFTFVMIFLVYLIAQKEGKRVAYQDMHFDNTSLPKVQLLVSKSLSVSEPEDSYLLFSANQDFVIVFTPLDSTTKQAYPNFKRVPKEQIEILQTYQ